MAPTAPQPKPDITERNNNYVVLIPKPLERIDGTAVTTTAIATKPTATAKKVGCHNSLHIRLLAKNILSSRAPCDQDVRCAAIFPVRRE